MELGAIDAPQRVELETDVVIVGTGAGGATMAAELTALGFSVVMIEEGGHHKTESFNTDPTASFRRLYRDAGMSAMLGNPPIGFAEGRCVGGSTVINGGMSWRTPERILEDWKGRGIPEIDPEAMAPHFEKVEKKIHVAHQSPESIGRDATMFRIGAERMGYKVIPNLRNQHNCLGSNNCMFGCPNKAKRSTLVTYVPEAMEGGATLIHGCRVERILMSGTRAVGVVGRFVDEKARPLGKTLLVYAKAVVSSCGAAQSPALLMRSGINMKHMGRHLVVHPNAKCIGIFPEPIVGWHGVHQAFQIREFEEEGLMFGTANIPPGVVALSLPGFGRELPQYMARYNDMLVSGVLVEDSHEGRVRLGPDGQPVLWYWLNATDMANFVRGVAIQAEVFMAGGADEVLTPFHDFPSIKSRQDIETMRRARLKLSLCEIFTVHIMGTARMGSSSADSVTDHYGRVHGTDNLFVADASIFPGPIGVNPMESIMGLVTRNVKRVAQLTEKDEVASARGWTSVTPEGAKTWTFDALCDASTNVLELLLRSGRAPSFDSLEGWEFKGYNPPFFAKLLGIRKFMKGFYRDGETKLGYNLPVTQNPRSEEWRARPSHDDPKRFGFYKVRRVTLEGPDNHYPNALLLDYGEGDNPLHDPSSLLRDYLVQVDSQNPDLLLGKAYIKMLGARIATSFFILERLREAPQAAVAQEK